MKKTRTVRKGREKRRKTELTERKGETQREGKGGRWRR